MRKLLKRILEAAMVLLLFLGFITFARSQMEKRGPVVVIDPGHGGSAPGAVYQEVLEKNLNLTVALKVRDLLAAEDGIQVILTREKDEDISLLERSEAANSAHATLFVSIHSNALDGDENVKGVSTFYHQNNAGGKKLAETVQRSVLKQTGSTDMEVKSEDFAVIRETKAPACLLEMGFMTCPEELARLQDDAYQTQIAQGVRDGILAFLKRG